MMILLVYIVLLSVYSICPFLLQIAGFILNAMCPDPIPFLDEFIMIACMVSKLERLDGIVDFAENHRILFIMILLVIMSLLAGGGYWLYIHFDDVRSMLDFYF